MRIIKEKSVAFTGYRTSKILQSSTDSNIIELVSQRLDKVISDLIDQGYNIFLSGMAEGFDLLAAEAVLRARMLHPEIKLISVIPYMGQELSYTHKDKERYKIILELTNDVVVTSDHYKESVFFVRNDFLLSQSSAIVCYYNGMRGGTMYTYNRAVKFGHTVINLYDSVNRLMNFS